ncbi:MAG: hypothetical protein OXN94_15770 [Chloroflexota bacterium]|nr:hypothetical protein [Chloroflexota bacterium]
MSPGSARQRFVEALAKHLPPSASRLRLLDIDGHCGAILARRRADLDIRCLAADDLQAPRFAPAAADAVVAFDPDLDSQMLSSIAASMRPGGRFIAVLPGGEVSACWVGLLEAEGLVRILVEPAVDGAGLLIRGEKPHPTVKPLGPIQMERIQSVARADADLLDLDRYRGPYLHLLIRQSPNKPVWKLAAGEAVAWRALALGDASNAVLLAFSSLPKAVGFLQPAVLLDQVRDVNKVGKFAREVAGGWGRLVMLNPTLDAIKDQQLIWLHIDPQTAAAPDE